MADAISIEETNKIRVAIGLPALPVPGVGGPTFKSAKDNGSSSDEDQGSTLESRQAQGYDNWKKLQEEQDAKAKREAKNAAIKKARDAARKYAVVEGKGLGDADEGADVDAKTWLKGAKKRQKLQEQEKARKLEQELAERDNAPEYTAEDLAGVKVGHELADFEEGGEQVLTLKDTTIDQNEEEGDELENLELREEEARNERLELKKKKPLYDPHAANEEGGTSLLKHYDETIDGKKRKRFTLDGQGATAEEREAMKQSVGERLKAQPISLDILKDDIPVSDYNFASESKIRKPKKKKAKSRQKPVDEDDIVPIEPVNKPHANGDAMDVDTDSAVTNGVASRPKPEITSFVDDDDLQAALAIQRRAALKKRKRTRPEDLARQLREEASATPDADSGANGNQVEEGGLVIDETSEFVANLQRAAEEGKALSVSTKASAAKAQSPSSADEVKDIDMDTSYNDIEDDEDLKARLKRETSTPAAPGLTDTGLENEATLNQGMGATLSMLTQRGLIKKEGESDINALHRKRQQFLAEKQKREAAAEAKARQQRERDRASGRLDRMSAREREEHARWENKQRDQQESRQMAEIFNRDYKPDVQLKYVDEFGRRPSSI